MRRGAVGLLLLLSACSTTTAPSTTRNGQWIWSEADAVRLEESAATHPSVGAGVWVASITYDTVAHAPRLMLALPPRTARRDSIAAVIRFESSFDPAWAGGDDAQLTAQLDTTLRALRTILESQAIGVQELQLDYDVPVRLLPRWAAVLRTLTSGALAGHEVWVTSLVAHLRERRYGSLLRGAVAGHIVQLFDTGEAADAAAILELEQLLERTQLPFRFGVGAFERQRPSGARTEHRRWFALVPRLQQHPNWRGLWIFAGGAPWTSLVGRLP